jgi:hypothetical protein
MKNELNIKCQLLNKMLKLVKQSQHAFFNPIFEEREG